MYIMNYNFMTDKSVIDPIATRVQPINGAQVSNAIFDHYNLLKDGSATYSQTIPSAWTTSTIMDCNFNGNINAGNISYTTQNLAGFRIKRRIKGTFAWLTLYDIATTDVTKLSFTKYDILNQHGVTYEYAMVPYLTTGEESAYIIKEVESELNGVFVCEPDKIVKFYGGLSYGTASMVNKTGTFEPLGSKYPIVVSNADTQYYKGSLSATAMTYSQLMGDEFVRYDTADYLKAVLLFFTDKNTKIIKDWNGNIWLAAVTGDASVTYNDNVGMGYANAGIDFVEIGSAVDYDSLNANGFINISFDPTSNTLSSSTV